MRAVAVFRGTAARHRTSLDAHHVQQQREHALPELVNSDISSFSKTYLVATLSPAQMPMNGTAILVIIAPSIRERAAAGSTRTAGAVGGA